MSIKSIILSIGVVILSIFSTYSQGTITINFSDLNPGSGQYVTNGYKGLNWQNAYIFNFPPAPASDYPSTGYGAFASSVGHSIIAQTGPVGSSTNTPINEVVISANYNFDFLGGNYALPYDNGQERMVVMNGYVNNTLVYSFNMPVNSQGASFADGFMTGINKLTFSGINVGLPQGASVGTPDLIAYPIFQDLQFSGLQVSPTPEPSSLALVGVGITAFLVSRKKSINYN